MYVSLRPQKCRPSSSTYIKHSRNLNICTKGEIWSVFYYNIYICLALYISNDYFTEQFTLSSLPEERK